MSTTSPKTGIRVKFVPNTMMNLVGKVLHFFHLDRVGEKAFEASHLMVSALSPSTEVRYIPDNITTPVGGNAKLEL